MRLKLAFVAALAMLGTVFVAPSPALAAPDSIACSAAGSYSRIIGFPGTPTADKANDWREVTDYNFQAL